MCIGRADRAGTKSCRMRWHDRYPFRRRWRVCVFRRFCNGRSRGVGRGRSRVIHLASCRQRSFPRFSGRGLQRLRLQIPNIGRYSHLLSAGKVEILRPWTEAIGCLLRSCHVRACLSSSYACTSRSIGWERPWPDGFAWCAWSLVVHVWILGKTLTSTSGAGGSQGWWSRIR